MLKVTRRHHGGFVGLPCPVALATKQKGRPESRPLPVPPKRMCGRRGSADLAVQAEPKDLPRGRCIKMLRAGAVHCGAGFIGVVPANSGSRYGRPLEAAPKSITLTAACAAEPAPRVVIRTTPSAATEFFMEIPRVRQFN
jgi:hypothetical protein